MPKRPQIELSREELDKAEIPMNHVLVRMVFSAEGAKSKGGIVIGFRTDEVFAEGDDSHSANMAEVYGIVEKVPQKLYFNPEDQNSMDWETDMELQFGDMVWFNLIESKNSVQVLCEDVIYKSIPYSDIYVAKRFIQSAYQEILNAYQTLYEKGRYWQIICLNGYVLCKPVYFDKISHLDAISEDKIDMTRGIIAFVGNPVKSYKNDTYSHIDDLRVGDEVLFDRKTPLFYLERNKSLACFDGDNMYWCIQRRRIACVLKRNN